MTKQRHRYPVDLMAKILGVSRSGYYRWSNRKPTRRERTDAQLKPLIRQAHIKGRRSAGPTKIQQDLREKGFHVGRDRIIRLRREMGLRCIQKKKFKATTNSKHSLPVAPNLLDQNFQATRPGTVYGADITYIRTGEGWLYLAGVKDFCTKEIVGYAMGKRMTKELVVEAFNKSLKYRKPEPGCIYHSDRGSQYCSHLYRRLLEGQGYRISMSRKGNCFDNAPTESFWGALKQEFVYHHRFRTREQARNAIQEWIEVFYNRIRRHSAIENIPPAIWADRFISERRAA